MVTSGLDLHIESQIREAFDNFCEAVNGARLTYWLALKSLIFLGERVVMGLELTDDEEDRALLHAFWFLSSDQELTLDMLIHDYDSVPTVVFPKGES